MKMYLFLAILVFFSATSNASIVTGYMSAMGNPQASTPSLTTNLCASTPTLPYNCVPGPQTSRSFAGEGYEMTQTLSPAPSSTVSISADRPVGALFMNTVSTTEWFGVAPPATLNFSVLMNSELMPVPGHFTTVVGTSNRSDLQLIQLGRDGNFNQTESLTIATSLSSIELEPSPASVILDSANGVISLVADAKTNGGINIIQDRFLPSGGLSVRHLILFEFINGIVTRSSNMLGLALPSVGETASFSISIPVSFQVDTAAFSSDLPVSQRLVVQQVAMLTFPVPEPSTFALVAGSLAALAWRRRAKSNP